MNMGRFAHLIAMVGALALAQGSIAAPKPADASAKPAASGETKAFGDWSVRCSSADSAAPCEMIEIRVAKKTGQRVLAVQLVYVPARDATIMIVAVPLGVALQNGVVLATDTFTSPVMHFVRCDTQGCYAQLMVPADTIGALGRATKAQIQIVFVDGRKINLPFSLDGFTGAHSALVDLAKAKAIKPAADAAPADQAPAQ